MATTTTQQDLPVPTSGDDPNIPDDLMTLALAIEKKLVGTFNSAADRSTRVGAPLEGQVSYLKDNNTFYYWDGDSWELMFPTQISITSGTVVPSNAVGNDGDIFFKTA
jgi:hypothetical protein